MVNNQKFEMTLHGFEVKDDEKEPEFVELTHNQQEAMDIALQRAKQRKAREHGQKLSN